MPRILPKPSPAGLFRTPESLLPQARVSKMPSKLKNRGWYNPIQMTIPRRWKFAIAFWALYAIAVIFYRRYPWVDILWTGVSMFAVLALSVYLVVKKYRSGGDERIHARSPLGYPHWLMHFLRDDDEKTEKNASR